MIAQKYPTPTILPLRELLPMFTTKDVVSRMSCVPNQVNYNGISLNVSVLGALPEAPKPVAGR